MTLNELREYLKRLYEIEKNIYEEEQAYFYLNSKLNKQVKYYETTTIKETSSPETSSYLIRDSITVFIIAGLFFILGNFSGIGLVTFFNLFALCFLIAGIIMLYIHHHQQQQEKERIAKSTKQRELIEKKNELLRMKDKNEKTSASTQLQILDKMLSDSKKLRTKYYDLNIIHPKYRNLVAISSIYEYIDTGRCRELEGPHGAYDTYEYMRELKEIKTDIRIVINQLEQIRYNQEMLYYAINESNRLSRAMIDSFQRTENMLIQTNQSLSDISEYQRQSSEYNRITANNTEYFKWLTIFQSKSNY